MPHQAFLVPLAVAMSLGSRSLPLRHLVSKVKAGHRKHLIGCSFRHLLTMCLATFVS